MRFAKTALLTCSQTCDDYYKLLELTLVFLGETQPRDIRMMALGAYRLNGWRRALYIGPLQTNAQTREEKALQSLWRTLRSKHWTCCQRVTAAPANDLCLIKSVVKYKLIDGGTSIVASNARSRRLWYIAKSAKN